MPSSSTFLLRGVIGEDVVTGLKLRMIWFWTSPTTLASITVRAAKVIRQWVIDKLPNDQASWNGVTKSKTSCGHWPLGMFSPSHSCLCCILLPGVHWQCPDPIELTPMAFDDWPSDSGWTDKAEQQLGSEPCNHWVDVKRFDHFLFTPDTGKQVDSQLEGREAVGATSFSEAWLAFREGLHRCHGLFTHGALVQTYT